MPSVVIITLCFKGNSKLFGGPIEPCHKDLNVKMFLVLHI